MRTSPPSSLPTITSSNHINENSNISVNLSVKEKKYLEVSIWSLKKKRIFILICMTFIAFFFVPKQTVDHQNILFLLSFSPWETKFRKTGVIWQYKVFINRKIRKPFVYFLYSMIQYFQATQINATDWWQFKFCWMNIYPYGILPSSLLFWNLLFNFFNIFSHPFKCTRILSSAHLLLIKIYLCGLLIFNLVRLQKTQTFIADVSIKPYECENKWTRCSTVRKFLVKKLTPSQGVCRVCLCNHKQK